MPEVYRLEFSDGKGVYVYSDPFYYEQLQCHQNDKEDHPRPEEDDMGRSAWADMIFGFASIEAMRAWFNGTERLFLSAQGIVLSKYFARGPIISGKKQLAFYRQSAALLWQKPLNHF